MKRFTLLFILLSTAVISNAQLSVSYTGDTTVKHLTANPSDTITSAGEMIGATGLVVNSRRTYAIGLYGSASSNLTTSPFTKYSIGVKGEATKADGMNYGVFGKVVPPSGSPGYLNYGAGVYGTKKNTIKTLSSTYAGYFDGPVGIYGTLTVSGTINGVVIGRGTTNGSSKTSAVTDESSTDVANSLSGLRMASFYLDQPADERVACEPSEQEEGDREAALKDENEPDAAIMRVHSRKHFALNADQLEEVFPDLVYENEDGTKSINYVEMVPILVQAINELKEEINDLKGTETAKKAKKATGLNEKSESIQVISLGQNKPNPFSTTTEVEVTVPETIQHAFVYVYDLQGKKVQQVDITARGKQTVSINAATLEEGMYLYSLIADGQVVQTRRLLVEK